MKRADSIIKKVKDGEAIIKEDTWPYYACVLISGKANVFKNVYGRQVLIGSLTNGDIFGEMDFLGQMQRNVSVIAEGDAIAEMISRETFMEFFDKFPRNVRNRLYAMVSNLTLCLMPEDGGINVV